MNAQQNLIRQLPDLDQLVQQLHDEPVEVLRRAFPPEDPRLAERSQPPAEGVSFSALEGFTFTEVAPEPLLAMANEPWFADGTIAITKIHNEGEDVELTPAEIVGLEAIVLLTGRPAILIQEGRFFPPPSHWQHLENVRDAIETTLRSVGRIEVDGHPSLPWVGTGFLVAKDVIMTNRHVAESFCQMGYRRRWRFKTGMRARIDYKEELGTAEPAEFEFRSVIGVHENLDMALFRVRRTSPAGITPPKPLLLAAHFPQARDGHEVYAVGYPAWDGRRNDPDEMLRIFSNIFNIKRLQPGEMRQQVGDNIFMHDCSTLGGNSGSCVVDLETNQVVGLHYGGRYLQGNFAVALWQLTDDPLIKKAKIEFA